MAEDRKRKRVMEDVKFKKLRGSQNFRLRLLLSTLTSTAIEISDIRSDGLSVGLSEAEVSLLNLIYKVSDDCVIKINSTGTKVKYKPGIVIGGRSIEHECSLDRSIAYYLEPLILLSLFGQKPLSITLKGITNDSKDPSIDTFESTTFPLLKRFGVPSEGLKLDIKSRGVSPGGGGEVYLTVPIVQNSLTAVNWTDVGLVKRIRGVSFSARVSNQVEYTMFYAARGIFNRFLPDVYIRKDHRAGLQAGKSKGFGISLVAETTTGCCISADTTVSRVRKEDEMDDDENELMPPDEVGEHIASVLLSEIEQGGVVDATHQGLLFLLCALCPKDISKVRVGKLSPYGIETLRAIKDFLGVTFAIKADPETETVILKCIGSGFMNMSRKLQ